MNLLARCGGVLDGPLVQATGPWDYEALGRERFWDMTEEQRAGALKQVVQDSNAGVLEELGRLLLGGGYPSLTDTRGGLGEP